ncbi:MAG: cytochrome c oxidase subunit I [Bacteroidetes bacterium]|nr:MAG: cytochrome c oxidase subunit I [Bacteroidota bacterium]MBL1143430.1 cytochrome c oxidase subunit I [Bacteroidota bacterium]MCB0802573.1 cbb3-type cytochrome c oxidase subunit I [Flavobacteriales bacterium]NOG56234.1 cytochrome c oxidase subunit I [Bacteroidota bacterium]
MSGAAHHHQDNDFLFKYIFSTDHKMISKQFFITGSFMGLIGMFMSTIFRLQLGFPGESFPFLESFMGNWAPDGILSPDKYLALVTMHGTIMVFFLLTAGLSGTFSNLLIPLQIGARDMASGFLNMLSYWFFFISSCIMIASIFVEGGPASGGWTIYPPLSALPQAIPGSGFGMTLWIVSMALFIVSSLLGSLNYIVTVFNLRTKGMSMTRLPLTIWAFLTTAVIGVLSFPVLFAAVLLLFFDRSLGTSFYLSDIYIAGSALEVDGGSPILFEHLFWFLGHPEVYIILLPSLGITSEVVATSSRKPIFGYRAMIGSILAIAFISFLVWGHHMFVTGMNPFLGAVFTFTTLLVAIPSAVKVFNYLTTLWKGNIKFTPAMLFAIGLVSTFITGGLTGIILGDSTLDINVHDTYFVVGHFHIVMGLSGAFGMFCGIYHWFPKMYGRMLNKNMGYAHFWLTLISSYGIFFPMHFLGLAGLPRRYYSNTEFPMFDNLYDLNEIVTWFAILAAFAQVLFLFNVLYSMFKGPKAPQNPWDSNTLEWTTPVEHIHGNWPGEIPEVHRWPYDYSKVDENGDYIGGADFIPQTVPLGENERDEGH